MVDPGECACDPAVDDDTLLVESTDCPGRGRLAAEPACLATTIEALIARDATAIRTRYRGRERAYLDDGVTLLRAAAHFADAIADHDDRLAQRARREPIAALREATERGGAVARLARETGLAGDGGTASDLPEPHVGLVLSGSRRRMAPPPAAELVDRWELDTDATVRVYDGTGETLVYHLQPAEAHFDATETATLTAAYEWLAERVGATAGPHRSRQAVRAVSDASTPVDALTRVLEKHTAGWGVLADLFADPAVTDVFATAPVEATPLRVRVDGAAMATNVRLTTAGARTFASRFRRESGRAFSRASPTLDATAETGGRSIRAAGVAPPVSESLAFAFRAHGTELWTLPGLVANGTVPPVPAGLLSLAVERGANLLVTGSRGAGKTTLLGALCFELPPDMRALVVEDTPELPVGRLRDRGRDVQGLHVSTGDGPRISPDAALRTALRLGDGALVVGEVRGEEARVLYEAMRVGAADGAVLGTIHGETPAAVRDRLVADLGVSERSFGATDAVVTVAASHRGGRTDRRLDGIAEVVEGPEGATFAPVFTADDTADRLGRGDSRLIQRLATDEESYADVRAVLADRVERIARVADGPTDPATVAGSRR